MGVLDKLAFWKHKEDNLSVPDVASYGTNLGLNKGAMDSSLGINQDPLQGAGFDLSRYTQNELGQQEQQDMNQPSLGEFQNPSQSSSFSKLNQARPQQMQQGNDPYSISKNIEVLSARMDTIKAMLDNLTEKVNKIEEMAEAEQSPHKRVNRW